MSWHSRGTIGHEIDWSNILQGKIQYATVIMQSNVSKILTIMLESVKTSITEKHLSIDDRIFAWNNIARTQVWYNSLKSDLSMYARLCFCTIFLWYFYSGIMKKHTKFCPLWLITFSKEYSVGNINLNTINFPQCIERSLLVLIGSF